RLQAEPQAGRHVVGDDIGLAVTVVITLHGNVARPAVAPVQRRGEVARREQHEPTAGRRLVQPEVALAVTVIVAGGRIVAASPPADARPGGKAAGRLEDRPRAQGLVVDGEVADEVAVEVSRVDLAAGARDDDRLGNWHANQAKRLLDGQRGAVRRRG